MVEDQGQGLLPAIAALLAGLGFPGFVVWLLRHFGARQDLIEVLRKALDKGRVRENAYCSALDCFISAVEALPNPPASLVAARSRALERMELAHCHLKEAAK
jgi:hypothetical protein